MNDNLPPLPPEGFVWNDPEYGDIPVAYTYEQMKAYARAAIEHHSAPTMPVAEITNIGDFGGFVKWLVHDGDLLKAGDRLFAAAPQPQPVQQEPIGVVVAIRWDDSGKTTRHAASLLESAKVNAGDMLYTSPQAQPLSDEQKQEIHNETGAGHALISLVESYITKGTT